LDSENEGKVRRFGDFGKAFLKDNVEHFKAVAYLWSYGIE
jgi:hypothetical protein